jgi:hypothetical protein
MADQPTCGRGLAHRAAVPLKLGELIAAMAENLDVHMRALRSDDEATIRERDAHRGLHQQQRNVADDLAHIGREMAGYADLPMGVHEQAMLSSEEVAETFRRFVTIEQEVLELLRDLVDQDERMLVEFARSR